jgi:uncharacterized protein (DUF302 family)
MTSSTATDDDLVTLPSTHDVPATVDRLKTLLTERKITLVADVDHAVAAHSVGLTLRPTRLLIFGNPRAGTPLMQSAQSLGLDLPLRVLVTEDEAGRVWLTFHRVEYLAARHGVTGQEEAVRALEQGLEALVRLAAG